MNDEDAIDDFDPKPVLQGDSGGVIRNAPWWMVSAGIHLVFLLGATLVAIEQSHALDGPVIEVMVHTAAPLPLIEKIEAPVGKTTREGPAVQDPDTSDDNVPDVFIPFARIGDHIETNNDEDYHQAKGQSKDFLSYSPGEAGGYEGRQLSKIPGSNASMGVGVGGGGGGQHGGPFGGRIWMNRRPRGQTRGTEDAVLAALKWLAHHQGPDGGWG